MKYISIITFFAAVVYFALGILIYRGRLKGLVNTLCKNPGKYKTLSVYVIAIGTVNLVCSAAFFLPFGYTLAFIAVSGFSVSVIRTLMRK